MTWRQSGCLKSGIGSLYHVTALQTSTWPSENTTGSELSPSPIHSENPCINGSFLCPFLSYLCGATTGFLNRCFLQSCKCWRNHYAWPHCYQRLIADPLGLEDRCIPVVSPTTLHVRLAPSTGDNLVFHSSVSEDKPSMCHLKGEEGFKYRHESKYWVMCTWIWTNRKQWLQTKWWWCLNSIVQLPEHNVP